MAGIGFELRKILSKDSYTSTMRAYLYAGLISSGPVSYTHLDVYKRQCVPGSCPR